MSRKKQDIIENTEQPEVTLQDFVIPAKIEAFCEKYKPLDHWREDCDMYTDYQLRTYFKAVVCPLGDPLAYLVDVPLFLCRNRNLSVLHHKHVLYRQEPFL